ncbi:GGDEF domain-containing protein, partial [Rhizobiaceae bacterium]|nr:GGDEF domain-containing protein [Rhizobiaceae bacterium]
MGAIVTLHDVSAANASRQALALATDRLIQNEADVTRKTRELEYLSTHDSLSGCLNRRTFLQRLDTIVSNAKATGSPVEVALVRIDRFRSIEEDHGPAVADRVLQTLAAVIKRKVSAQSIVGRHGSGSLLAAEPGMSQTRMLELGSELLKIVASDEGFALPGGGRVRVSMAASRLSDSAQDAERIVAATEHDMRVNRGGESTSRVAPEVFAATAQAAPTIACDPRTALMAGIDRTIQRAGSR